MFINAYITAATSSLPQPDTSGAGASWRNKQQQQQQSVLSAATGK
jgi:hypothetical protein